MSEPSETRSSNPTISQAPDEAAEAGEGTAAEPSAGNVTEPGARTSQAPRSMRGQAPTSSGEAGDPLEQARAEIERLSGEASRMKDQWMRTAADFDNFRKRARRELEEARRGGREDLLRELLPVFDNLERAISSAQRATDVKAVVDGLAMIQRQFVDTLGKAGIGRVPTTGQSFDPSVHEAIQQVETDEHAPGTVVAEVQPGYLSGDRLVRAAMVVVAKPKASEGDVPGESN